MTQSAGRITQTVESVMRPVGRVTQSAKSVTQIAGPVMQRHFPAAPGAHTGTTPNGSFTTPDVFSYSSNSEEYSCRLCIVPASK
jgi:hypothetical protein